MRVTQQQVSLTLFGLMSIASAIVSIGNLITGEWFTAAVAGIACIIFSSLGFSYGRGWETARYILIVLVALIVALFLGREHTVNQPSFAVLLPLIVALILSDPLWVIGCAIIVPLAIELNSRVQFQSPSVYSDWQLLVVYGIIVGSLILSRMVTDTAQSSAIANARRAETALARSEGQAQELARKAEELTLQNDQQRRLIDLVATLETPVVALAEGVLLAPVVGHLDSRRAQDLTNRILHEVSAQRARMVVLDIAGVATVDTEVAQALLRATQAVRLLGCKVTVSGISAGIAATMTTLGISMAGVATARTPQEALERAMMHSAPPNGNGLYNN